MSDMNKSFKPLSKKAKLAAFGLTTALIATGIVGGFAYHSHAVEQGCKDSLALFQSQSNEIKSNIKSVDISIGNVTGDKALPHTAEFDKSKAGVKDIKALQDVAKELKKHSSDTVGKCSSSAELDKIEVITQSRQEVIDEFEVVTKAFNKDVDKHRLKVATKEAKDTMESAKTNLAKVHEEVASYIKEVDSKSDMASDNEVKQAYDKVKATDDATAKLSTTVVTKTYKDAVESIDKAKAIVTEITKLTEDLEELKITITDYHNERNAVVVGRGGAASASGWIGPSTTRTAAHNPNCNGEWSQRFNICVTQEMRERSAYIMNMQPWEVSTDIVASDHTGPVDLFRSQEAMDAMREFYKTGRLP